jgi:hypothetical protein
MHRFAAGAASRVTTVCCDRAARAFSDFRPTSVKVANPRHSCPIRISRRRPQNANPPRNPRPALRLGSLPSGARLAHSCFCCDGRRSRAHPRPRGHVGRRLLQVVCPAGSDRHGCGRRPGAPCRWEEQIRLFGRFGGSGPAHRATATAGGGGALGLGPTLLRLGACCA